MSNDDKSLMQLISETRELVDGARIDTDAPEIKLPTAQEAWDNYMAALDRELEEAKLDTSVELFKTWIAYSNHRNRLSAADKAVGAKMTQLEETVVGRFQDLGLTKWTSNGRTIFLRKELWAGALSETDVEKLTEEAISKLGDVERDGKKLLCAALKAAGLTEYVSEGYNTQSISSYVREFDPDKNYTVEEIIALLPEALRPFIKVTEKIKIGNRKA